MTKKRPGNCLRGNSGLACAILERAVRDARSTNGVKQDALRFLESDGCQVMIDNLCFALDVDGDQYTTDALLMSLGDESGQSIERGNTGEKIQDCLDGLQRRQC